MFTTSRLQTRPFTLKNLVVYSLLACAPLWLAGCRSGSAESSAPRGAGGPSSLPPKGVKVTPSVERELARTVEASGTLAADEQATLSFKVPGRLATLSVDLGSQVRRGQAVAQLETLDYKARVAQAEAALQQARARLGLAPQGPKSDEDRLNVEQTSLVREARAVLEEARLNRERTARLVREGVQAQAEMDRAESAFKVAESRYQDALEEMRNRQSVLSQRRVELNIANQQLAETTLYAPYDGAVRERRANAGEYLTAGAPVLTIVQVHPLRLRVEVPEREARGIRPGLPVKVLVEGDAQSYAGRVARLSPAFQEQSRTLIIEAEVENQHGRLRPGSFAKAELQTTSSTTAVTVPASAVVTFAGIQKVFTVKDGKAVERNVVVGHRTPEWVEITEGLQADEPVIIAPGNLVSGQPVKTE
jgi:RND family efflux transporter MFP subunit